MSESVNASPLDRGRVKLGALSPVVRVMPVPLADAPLSFQVAAGLVANASRGGILRGKDARRSGMCGRSAVRHADGPGERLALCVEGIRRVRLAVELLGGR